MSRFVRLVSLVTGAALVAVSAAAPASAAPKPKVTFHVTSTATKGGTVLYNYADKAVPKGGHVLLQRQVGTAHVWKTQLVLKGKSGTGHLRMAVLGKTQLRVVVVDKHKRALVSQRRPVTVYTDIPLSALCLQPSGNAVVSGTLYSRCNESGTTIIGGHAFTYMTALDATGTPTQNIVVTRSTCRAIHLDFGISSVDPLDTDEWADNVGTVQLAQSASDPYTVSVALDTVGSINAALDGGAWSLTSQASHPIYGKSLMWINGTMSCYTLTGV